MKTNKNWYDEIITKKNNCILGKPLLICIPPEGIDICCPVHGKHRLYGQKVFL